jgi:hypothetical protein
MEGETGSRMPPVALKQRTGAVPTRRPCKFRQATCSYRDLSKGDLLIKVLDMFVSVNLKSYKVLHRADGIWASAGLGRRASVRRVS